MRYLVTPEQEYILSILQKTRIMDRAQAYKLLNILGGRNERYADRCLNQLRHIRKIVWKSEDLITFPFLYKADTDWEMLSAIDIMMELCDFKVSELAADKPPYKLCFITEQDSGMGNYGVVIVRPGQEAPVSGSINASGIDGRTVIFLLSEISQKNGFQTNMRHFFVVKNCRGYRYFEGGV